MQTAPFVEAARELRGRFYSLVESLSALRELVELDVKPQSESKLVESALRILLKYQDLSRCSVYASEGEDFEWLAGIDWDDNRAASEASLDHRARHPALTDGFLRQVAATAEPVHWRGGAGESVSRSAPAADGSLLCARITARTGTLAVVAAHHPSVDHFGASHEQMTTLFCGVLGHVLENSRLLRSLELAVSERTRQLESALREAEQLKRRYEQLSNIDELTALHNRRFFFPEAESALSRCVRHGHALSLMLIDLDHFKAVNDTFGHAAGDQVLRDVARCLQEQIRDGDIVARYGGEEFVLALPNTDLAGARLLAQRITVAFSELTWQRDTGAFTITASIGLTELGERTDHDYRAVLEAMLREADTAMYQRKDNGRNGASTFDDC